jgi:DNA primase catalytic core
LKAACNIVEIVGRYVDLNNNNTGVCPFHDDSNPSLKVYPDTQSWYCFGCPEGGDVIEFLMKAEEKSFADVVTQLSKEAKMEMPAGFGRPSEATDDGKERSHILTVSADYYQSRLTPQVREYLNRERGLIEETTKAFRIGFADGNLRDHLLELKIPTEDCIKAGVLRRTEAGSVIDYFSNRIILPNVHRGQVVHLTGRSAGDVEPKYLHPPGKIQFLFNEGALNSDSVILAEGPFDCIAAEQQGFHAVGLYGTSGFKVGFEKKFQRCQTVYVCMDGDEPGRKAAIHIAEALGGKARIVSLPEDTDLNDFFLTHTKDEFEILLKESRDLVTYLLDFIPVDTDKPDLADALLPVLKALAILDPPKAEGHLSKIKERYGLTRDDIAAYRRQLKGIRSEIEEEAKLEEVPEVSKPRFTLQFDGLVDVVESGGDAVFLTASEAGLKVEETATAGQKILIPPALDLIPWPLPRASEVIRAFESYKTGNVAELDHKLFVDLVAYHKSISELPSDEYYDFVALWVMHTYLFEHWEYSPILCLFAVPERGKSRTGKGVVFVSHRGVHVESLREAYLLRLASDYGATVFIDVLDLWRKAERSQSEDIILQRFERGAKVFRVLYPDRGPFEDMVTYSIFGPTVVGTNEAVDPVMETRCVVINMPSSNKVFEMDVKPEGGLELRERLLAFRAKHMQEQLPPIDKPAERRLGDVLRPIMQVLYLVCPDRKGALEKLILELDRQRQERKSDTLEGEILKAVYVLEDKTHQGKLKVADITTEVNVTKLEKFQTTEKSVGRKLTALGFKKVWSSDGRRAIVYDKEFLEVVCEKYGIHIKDVEAAKG